MKFNRKTIGRILLNLVAWLVSIVVIVPLLLVLLNAFKDKREAASLSFSLPTKWCFDNFKTVIEQGKLLTSLFNSLEYALIAGVLCVLLAALAAFVLSRNRRKLHKAIYWIIIMGIAMPVNYAALMKVMQTLHLVNTRFGLILLYTAIQLPFSVFLCYGFVTNIPVELDEAAVLDGCSPLRMMIYVILPLLKPVLVTTFILVFMNCWNEFILPLYYMNTTTAWPMTLSVYNFFGRYSSQWNLVCADILLTCLPVVVVYLFGQKHIIGGMTVGAVKG